LLTAGQRGRLNQTSFLQDRKERVDLFQIPGALAAHLSADDKVFFHGERLKKLAALRNHGDAGFGNLIGTHRPDLSAIERDHARLIGQKTGDRPHECRLAGTVCTDDGDDFAGLHVDINVEQSLEVAVVSRKRIRGQ